MVHGPCHSRSRDEEFRPPEAKPDLNFTDTVCGTGLVAETAGIEIADGRHRLAGNWKGIGDAPIFFIPVIVTRLARLSARAKSRSDRRKWSGGSADGRVQSRVSDFGALAVCSAVRE